MKNNKGFTLAELLVVVAIIALISIMVFPAISKMWSTNEKKKFESYEKMTAEFAEANREKGLVKLCDLGEPTELTEVKNECEGYVTYDAENDKYKAYIKCEKEDYKTEGFDSTYSSGKCN